MTNTEVTSRVIGSAWPQHFNRPIAESLYTNITAVGLPQWDAADQTLARAVQKELGQPERGLAITIGPLTGSGIELKTRPVTITSWAAWRAAKPDTRVLSHDTGYRRDNRPGAP